jgi:DNA polymerase-3 subunit delta'
LKFQDIIGHANEQSQLRGLVDNNRLPHALLMLGQAGCGALPLAMSYVQYILCDNKTEEGDSCGMCNTCQKSSKFIHPDIHFSYPTIGSKTIATHVLKEWREAFADNPYLNVNDWLSKLDAENKQGNIPTAECVEIVKKLSLKSFEAPYKILIMWLPEYLGKEGNRLLKMIEEPPDQTLFILVAENQDLILPTILSRCQLIKVPPLSDEEVKKGLQLRGVSESEAEVICHLADGDFNAALSLAKEEENDNAQRFLEWMRLCYNLNGAQLVPWIDKFAAIGREKQKLFLKYGLHFIRELMYSLATGNEQLRLRGHELESAKRMKTVVKLEHIDLIVKLFDECHYHVERNANPKILFLDASIKINGILKGKITEGV